MRLTLWLSLAGLPCGVAFLRLASSSCSRNLHVLEISKREAEIRRKIIKLKKEGRINNKGASSLDDELEDDDDAAETRQATSYDDKVVQRLGKAKSKMLGYSSETPDATENAGENANDGENDSENDAGPRGQLGAIGAVDEPSEGESPQQGYISPENKPSNPLSDPSLFLGDDDEDSVSEEDLVDLVASKLMEKRDRERREEDQRLLDEARAKLKALEDEREAQKKSRSSKQLTSGVGGSWSVNETAAEEMYQPKTGSWGKFPRPKDISKTYGGGRRIGPGFSDEEARSKSSEDTRERLKRYREKMGIDVKSEKEYAAEIDEALNIASLAMQRGIYSTAVSALEKVTKWCSTNSKVGGKVFLELAMAYEAAGRTKEAITVYKTLSTCRMEDVKFNAKRLLYSLEAMEFMQKEVRSSEFTRKQASSAFIETTGLENFASNFDDVYQTAYVDLQGSFFKKLTQSVVRTTREARQIILRATNSGEVDRTRIIQALRALSRYFDEALQKEIERNTVDEPVAIMNGQPIIANKPPEEVESNPDGFKLMDPAQMVDRLNGEWRLQLLANKRGDGVKFFNSTLSSQKMNTKSMTFSAVVPLGFVSIEQSGKIAFNEKRRILRRQSVEVLGGGVLAAIFKGTTTGAPAAVRLPQQVVTVDSVIMVTRGVPSMRVKSNDAEKDYFAVWRKVEIEPTEL
jgi:hypothetical protein